MKNRENLASTDASPSADPRDGGLLFGCILDGDGSAREISREDALAWRPSTNGEVLWLHLDRTAASVANDLSQLIDVSETTLDVLLSNETRPRAYREKDALITVLRGINFNPGAEPEDMIALQVWADAHRVITLRRRRLQTPRDILAELQAGAGPQNAGDLVTRLMVQLVAKMNFAIVDMNDALDLMETEHSNGQTDQQLDRISSIRRECLALKRYMSPQQEALVQVERNPPVWMSDDNRADIRETIDRLTRYLEELDVSKESAIVLQDDFNNRAAAKMNKTMYMLSIVTAVFLPMGFVTGLLGINVGGMPGVNSHVAFWITVGLLIGLLIFEYFLLKRLKWL